MLLSKVVGSSIPQELAELSSVSTYDIWVGLPLDVMSAAVCSISGPRSNNGTAEAESAVESTNLPQINRRSQNPEPILSVSPPSSRPSSPIEEKVVANEPTTNHDTHPQLFPCSGGSATSADGADRSSLARDDEQQLLSFLQQENLAEFASEFMKDEFTVSSLMLLDSSDR